MDSEKENQESTTSTGTDSFLQFPEFHTWILPWREFSEATALEALNKTNRIYKKPEKETGKQQLGGEETNPLPGPPPPQAKSSWLVTV